jgi:hypothetical protein
VVIGDAYISRRIIRLLIREIENQNNLNDNLSKSIIYCSCEIPKLTLNVEPKFIWNKDSKLTEEQKINISLGRLQQDTLAESLRLWNEDVNSNKMLDIQLHDLQVEKFK